LQLHIDLHAVKHENLALASLAYLIRIEQLKLAGTFVVVVLNADAPVPFLDLPFGSPETDIDWLRSVED
jgi:hypothetical protein